MSLLTARLQEVEQTQGEIAGVKALMGQLAAQASSSTRLADEHAQGISQLEQLACLSGMAKCITDGLVGCMRSSEVIETAYMAIITSTSLGHRYTYVQVVSPDFARTSCAIMLLGWNASSAQ